MKTQVEHTRAMFRNTDLKYIFFINLIFVALGVTYVYIDNTIPYWDSKVHVQNSFSLITAAKELDFHKIVSLLQSERAPGPAIALVPFSLLFPETLGFLQFFMLLIYGNVFVLGTVLLARTIWPQHNIFWFVTLSITCPILWALALKPYFDVAPLALTPWLFYAALRTDYFQKKLAAAFLGFILALEIIFRSYGAYICVAFFLSYMMFFLEDVIRQLINKKFSWKNLQLSLSGISIAVAVFAVISYVPLSGLYKVVSADIGNTSYLWASGDSGYYIKVLLNTALGGLLFYLSVLGLPLLAAGNPASRLLVYFSFFFLIVFQFHVTNKDSRYVGALAAIAVVSAGFFLTHLSNLLVRHSIDKKLQLLMAAVFISLLTHQLLTHIFNIRHSFNMTLATTFHYPKEPLYRFRGNQSMIVEGIFSKMDSLGTEQPTIYVGKDKNYFNHDYLTWVQTHSRPPVSGKRLIFHGGKTRYHGIPVNFFDIDFVLLGKSSSAFDDALFLKKEAHPLLRNFRRIQLYNLVTNEEDEFLELWQRDRWPTLHEQIEDQAAVIAFDPENLHNLDQLLWLYKIKAVNLLTFGDELTAIAKLIPHAFSGSNIGFDQIKHFINLTAYSTTANENFLFFFQKRGVSTSTDFSSHELTPEDYDKRYCFEWLFMVRDNDVWSPLTAQKWRGEKWDDRKWGTLISESYIDYQNKLIVIDKPLGIFWISPRSQQYEVQVSIAASHVIKKDDFEFNLNKVNKSASCQNQEKYSKCSVRIQLKKNDVLGLVFRGRYTYKPAISISPVTF